MKIQQITPCLWFDDKAEEATKFYTSIFENSKILKTTKYSVDTPSNKPAGSVMTVTFSLNGQEFTALNGGSMFKFTEAMSLIVMCENQEEIDYYWGKLSAVPQAEVCGWLKDKYGVSWQIVPYNLDKLVATPQSMKLMLTMKKLDIEKLKEANKEK